MEFTGRELQKLRTRCNKLADGPDYRVDDYVLNLLITVLDFQMNSDVVDAAIHYFEDNHGFKTHKKMKQILSGFSNTKKGNLALANFLWNNRHWTRAKFLRKLLAAFEERGIKGQKSLQRWFKDADFERDVKGQFKTKEHSIGPALFHWLRLRLGFSNTIKADVHIMNFVADAIGRKISQKEAFEGLLKVAEQTRRNAALLDAAIWHYQKENG
ncbi:MAG: hypothetical protein HUN05_09375 [Desulfobacter sp.]|nr:MAG: hypothetical protein HUN05_09375 [Desulfobacter sp.]